MGVMFWCLTGYFPFAFHSEPQVNSGFLIASVFHFFLRKDSPFRFPLSVGHLDPISNSPQVLHAMSHPGGHSSSSSASRTYIQISLFCQPKHLTTSYISSLQFSFLACGKFYFFLLSSAMCLKIFELHVFSIFAFIMRKAAHVSFALLFYELESSL